MTAKIKMSEEAYIARGNLVLLRTIRALADELMPDNVLTDENITRLIMVSSACSDKYYAAISTDNKK